MLLRIGVNPSSLGSHQCAHEASPNTWAILMRRVVGWMHLASPLEIPKPSLSEQKGQASYPSMSRRANLRRIHIWWRISCGRNSAAMDIHGCSEIIDPLGFWGQNSTDSKYWHAA